MGKASWITYLYERVSGLEVRPIPLEGASMLPPSRDRQAFPGAYAMIDALDDAATRGSNSRPLRRRGAPRRPPGRGLGVHRPADLRPDRDRPRHRELQGRARRARRGRRVPPGGRAGQRVLAPERALRPEEEFVFALADALREEYKAIVDAGLAAAGRRRGADARGRHDDVARRVLDDYRRWADLRVAALNHALEGLPEDRVRYHICWGSWHGPHVFDLPLKDIVDLILRSAPARTRSSRPTRATSTSGACGRTSSCPRARS